MNLKQAQLAGQQFAENASKERDAILLKNYDRALKEITAELERINAVMLSGVAPKDFYVTMIKFERLAKLQRLVSDTMTRYSKAAGKEIIDSASMTMYDTFYRRQFLTSWVAPNMSFSPLDDRLVNLTVTGTANAWKDIPDSLEKRYGDLIVNYQPQYGTITDILAQARSQDLAAVQMSIVQGFVQGKTIAEITKDITAKIDTAKYKAERIARTEFTRLSNAGNYAASKDAEAQGVEIKRMWVATLDSKTRPLHGRLDGQTVGIDEPFHVAGYSPMYPGAFGDPAQDINCRCTVVEIINDLPPTFRRARAISIDKKGRIVEETGRSQTIDWTTYAEWAEKNGITKLIGL